MIYKELLLKVQAVIQDVFPSGINFESQEGQRSLAYKNYRKLCNNNHLDAVRKWEKFVCEFGGVATFTLMPPRRVGKIDLCVKEGNGVVLTQQVVVELSGIYPFYTIYGLDIFKYIHSPNFVSTAYSMVVSPISMFKEAMEEIRSLMSDYYPNSIFLPQKILNKTVSVNLPGAFSFQDPTIYQVLFHPDQPPYRMIRGDKNYGVER